MKKNIIFAALAAASAILVSASCTKQEQPESIREAKTFTAVIEQDATKTVLTSANKVEWESGDLIMINESEYSAIPNTLDATKATFTLSTGMEPTTPYSAIYPTDLYVSTGSYSLPGTQYYSASKFNAPMYAKSSTENFSFKNICGVLCFSLKGTDKVKSIKITANEPVCGGFTMTDATTINFTGTDKSVVLTCTSPVQLNSATPTDFYIYLPPGTYSAGMTVVITNDKGDAFVKYTTKSAPIARGNIYKFAWTPTFIEGALLGTFSVSATEKVRFSKGNLQATYNGSYYTWGFAEHQYDYIGNGSGNTYSKLVSPESGKVVDLFGWSTPATNYGISRYNTAETYSGSFRDWGGNIGTGWRTLTKDQWIYLIKERANNTNLRKINVLVNGNKCLVLAPDNYSGTIASSYSATEWANAEADGLVCLPAAGRRYADGAVFNFNWCGVNGYYWSSTIIDDTRANAIQFGDGLGVGSGSYTREYGCSVRLVTNAD